MIENTGLKSLLPKFNNDFTLPIGTTITLYDERLLLKVLEPKPNPYLSHSCYNCYFNGGDTCRNKTFGKCHHLETSDGKNRTFKVVKIW